MIRKIISVVSAAFLALSIFGCSSSPSSGGGSSSSGGAAASAQTPTQVKGLNGVPPEVNEAYLKASEDVIIGIGTYSYGGDMKKFSIAKTNAELRARADISRQLQSLVKDMVTDYSASSEVDPTAALSFQEQITQSLSKNELTGSHAIGIVDSNGVLWVIMEYSKSSAKEAINQAQAAAKLAIPAAAAFDALSRMDNAFDAAGKGDPTTTVTE